MICGSIAKLLIQEAGVVIQQPVCWIAQTGLIFVIFDLTLTEAIYASFLMIVLAAMWVAFSSFDYVHSCLDEG